RHQEVPALEITQPLAAADLAEDANVAAHLIGGPIRRPEDLHRLTRQLGAAQVLHRRQLAPPHHHNLETPRMRACCMYRKACPPPPEAQPRKPRSSVANLPTFGSTEARSPGARPNQRASVAAY